MRTAASALLVVCLLTAAWWIVRGSRLGLEGRRRTLLVTAVLAGTAITLWTELLGSLGALSSSSLLAVWLLASAAVVLVALKRRRSAPFSIDISTSERLLVGGVGVVLATTALVAVSAPPNTSDAMSYHLPRVMHWLQNGSLAAYPTHVLLQIKSPPGAEYLMLNLVALAGNDHLVNLVQWAAFLATIVAVSFVAALLGGNRIAQVLAAILFATLPMAILEASGSKNDVVTSLWIVSLAAFVLLFRRQAGLASALLVGLATGLALLTRPTAYVYAAPLLVWFLALAARNGLRRGAAYVVVAVLAALLLNGSYYEMNIRTLGSPLGPSYEQTARGVDKYTNSLLGPRAFASNVVRNAALHLSFPVDGVNSAVERTVAKIHQILGISENDTRTTWRGTTFSVPRGPQRRFEDRAPNTLHFLLGLAAAALYFGRRKLFRVEMLPYVSAIVGGAALFCLLFRWQPWHSRLHTPLFALSAPFVAVVAARILGARLVVGLGAVLLVAAFPWVFRGEPRPAIGPHSVFSTSRTDQYFANQSGLEQPFLRAVRTVADRRCRHIGLLTDAATFEYPLWPLLTERIGKPIDIEDVAVQNASTSARKHGTWKPCAALAIGAPDDALTIPRKLEVGATSLRRSWIDHDVALFLPPS